MTAMAEFAWAERYPSRLIQLLNGLNDYQLRAACVGTGQAAVAGCPGSGKTRTIVARIGRLVAAGLDPDYILAMTFTRAAAAEMTERLTGLEIHGARVGTIHSVARQIVAAETHLFDHGELDEGWRLFYELKKLLSDMRRQGSLPGRGTDLEAISRFIESCKACGPCYVFGDPWGLNMRAEEFILRQAREWSSEAGIRPQQLAEIYLEMERRRVACGLYDYNDMQLWGWMQLVADDVSRQKWRNRWSVVIVDEAQDSNKVQWDLARFLVGLDSCIEGVHELPSAPTADDGNHNLMVGGDSSQSIFGWRSAVPREFVGFAQAEQTQQYVLPVNYRSNPTICAVCTSLVRGKKWHLVGEIQPHSVEPAPDAVVIRHYDNPEAEAAGVLDAIQAICQDKPLGSCAVLARLRIGLDMAEIECIRRRIKYIKRASGSFLESREVKDILAYIRVAAGYDPDGEWIKHLINRPFRYIGREYLRRCEEQAQQCNISLLDAIVDKKRSLSFRQRRAIDQLVELLQDMNTVAVKCEQRAVQEEKRAKDNRMVVDGKLSMEVIERLAQREEARLATEQQRTGLAESAASLHAAAKHAGGGRVDGRADASAPDEPIRGPADLITMMLDRTHYIDAVRREEGLSGIDESKLAVFGELHRMASMFKTPSQFLSYIDALRVAVQRAAKSGLRVRNAADSDALVLSTIHSCVHPETLIETDRGLQRIGAVASNGSVATPYGMRKYVAKVEYKKGPMLRITTAGGYVLRSTPDHGIMAWDGTRYSEMRADRLDAGMWLRLRLPESIEEAQKLIGVQGCAPLPPLPDGDVRAEKYSTPKSCTSDAAELFGMLVADGTVYHAGFRFHKYYQSSVTRFSQLCSALFNRKPPVLRARDRDMWYCEVNSTRLAAWLNEIGGMSPNQKAVPQAVLASGLPTRAAFLSGLFEDGTVNVRPNGHVDHVSLSNRNEHIAEMTQLLLLQLGITSRRFHSGKVWRVDISGQQAQKFGFIVGFSNKEKQALLHNGTFARTDRMCSIPLSYEQASMLQCPWAKQNGRFRGSISRMKAEQEPSLTTALQYHHVKIVEIDEEEGEAMCLEVPDGGRFLQNGFDACNSKGLQWDHVFLVDVVEGRFPCARSNDYEEELRLLYVAVSRAAKTCTVSYTGEPLRDASGHRGRTSPFIPLVEAGIRVSARGVTSS